MNLNIVR